MKAQFTTAFLTMLLAAPACAGKLNLDTGESCFGPACADMETPSAALSNPEPKLGGYSAGIYRIPYEDGTMVKISHGYFEHDEPGKLDMHGKGIGTHRVVAAADGQIMHIEDSRSKQQNPNSAFRNGPCVNNFIWIRHDNGEWSKYSHLSTGSTTGAAGLSEGQRVTEGTYLGDRRRNRLCLAKASALRDRQTSGEI